MKRIIFSLIAFVVLLIGVNAERIPVAKARMKAGVNTTLVYTAETAGKADFYVFQKSQGFTIVAADDVVGDVVLGRVDDGEFDYSKMPDNLKWWLSQYQEQIEYLRQKAAKGEEVSVKVAEGEAEVIVAPLLGGVTWDQGDPYNRLCPSDDGGRCVTGCAATAMAMVMYYHKWPLQGTGKHSYRWNGKTLSVDFSQSYYDWSNMLDSYYNYTETQADAVAKLMYDCGVSLDMQYGSAGSSASPLAPCDALPKYFKYKSSLKYYFRDNYKNKWNDLLKTDLDRHLPILYSGYDSSGGGHGFVCDGYDSDDYFHFNFGWSGSGNGWYLSSIAGEFPNSQIVIMGVEPIGEPVVVGKLNYTKLNNEKVEVARPASASDYAGDITIPSSVTIDGSEYTVVSIATQAFAGCTGLKSLVVPSTITMIGANAFVGCSALENIMFESNVPFADVKSNLFDVDTYNATRLCVPAGCINAYSDAVPWKYFATIADAAGAEQNNGKWEKMMSGTATWKYCADVFSSKVANVNTYKRKSESCTTQILITNWGNDVQLSMKLTEKTGAVTISQQYTGAMWGEYGRLSIQTSGVGSYDEVNQQMILPVTYGLPDLGVGYYAVRGTDTLQFVGEGIKNYAISVRGVEAAKDFDDGKGEQDILLALGKDVQKIKYVIKPTYITADEADTIVSMIADGRITAQEYDVKDKSSLTVLYPRSGKYAVVMATISDEGVVAKSAYKNITYASANGWKVLGEAPYKDDFVASVFTKVAQYEYPVTVEESVAHPGRFRLKDPYGKVYPPNKDGKKTTDRVTVYMEIDATDPTAVFIPSHQDMNVNLNDKTHGEMSISSRAAEAMDGGKTLEEVKAEGLCGSITDCVITFPKNTLSVYFPLYSLDWNDANIHGTFRLDLSGLITAITPIAIEQRHADGPAYNLNGVRVNDHYKGFVIKNGKKYIRR